MIELLHGCTYADWLSILRHGIDPTRGVWDTDFGQGFYTTTWRRQAAAWAWGRSLSMPLSTSGSAAPVVIRFRIARANLAALETLAFAVGDFHEEAGFWSLVHHCRTSTPPGIPPSTTPGTLHNHKCTNQSAPTSANWYDIVVGPVAAFWYQRAAMLDADQISFHTVRAAKLLNDLVVQHRLGTDSDPVTVDWVGESW